MRQACDNETNEDMGHSAPKPPIFCCLGATFGPASAVMILPKKETYKVLGRRKLVQKMSGEDVICTSQEVRLTK